MRARVRITMWLSFNLDMAWLKSEVERLNNQDPLSRAYIVMKAGRVALERMMDDPPADWA